MHKKQLFYLWNGLFQLLLPAQTLFTYNMKRQNINLTDLNTQRKKTEQNRTKAIEQSAITRRDKIL